IKQITNSGLKEQIAAAQTAGDQALVDTLTEKKLYINAARLLLLAVFSGVAYLVYIAYRKRIKEGRFI
ncbi:MAG TPA: hypothetical protein PLB46_05200, partial [Chitinophagales bacterium]|nr:hypothetical protein [Chitinophagales bacterium]